jgi:galactokinase
VSVATQLDTRTADLFRETFKHNPDSVAVAPGRMNIIGEHTDYNEGFVLPAAIDRQIGVAVSIRKDARVLIRSDRYPTVISVGRLPQEKEGSWADYVFGVAHELEARTSALPGFEVAITSQIPIGSGLSSSGALEVATALALLAARGLQMPALAIAQLCQRAENGYVGARTGIMDQFTALEARAGHAMLLDCRSLQHADITLADPTVSWLLADTGVHHQLAGSAYNERRAQCEAAARALGLRSLRDGSEADLQRIDDPLLKRRVRHVVTENSRVLTVADLLKRRRVREVGPILFASHLSLRTDFEVSCAELDCLVDLAADVPQVIGARMTGGGFGGCVLLLLEATGIDEVEQRLVQGYQGQFDRSPAFYRVRSVDGAMRGRS